MPLGFITQGRNSSVRNLVRNSNVETTVSNTWTISSLISGLNTRTQVIFSTLNFKAQSPGSGPGGAGQSGGCYGTANPGGNGGFGSAGAFVNTNITKSSSMSTYTITLGSPGTFGINTSNNIQAGGRGGYGRAYLPGYGGTIAANLVFTGANTFYVPYGGAGGGGGTVGASGHGAAGGPGSPGANGTPANSTSFGKSGNGGSAGGAACYNTTSPGVTQTAIAFTPLAGATYIYPTNTAPPAHGISTWTSNNYGAGAAGQIAIPSPDRGSNTTPAPNGSSGVFRLTVSGIRI
jgi:hypothetical protein